MDRATKKIPIVKVKIDESVLPRHTLNEQYVGKLALALRFGTLPPPIVEARTFRIVDGRHTLEAHKRLGMKTIDVVEKVYKDDADLFADAIRRNASHGLPLSSYDIRIAVVRLQDYGWTKEAIGEVVRVPVDQVEKVGLQVVHDESGQPIPLKMGLAYLRDRRLSPEQIKAHARYSGDKAIFHIRQIAMLIDNDMTPPSAMFASEMDALVRAWTNKRKRA
jgi:hypothetical protein